MTLKSHRRQFFGAFFLPFCVSSPLSAAPSPDEALKIESLLLLLSEQTGVQFYREGSHFTAVQAAHFLRKKLQSRAESISSLNDFIHLIATQSSTTGRPYHVRFDTGESLPSAVYLRRLIQQKMAIKPSHYQPLNVLALDAASPRNLQY